MKTSSFSIFETIKYWLIKEDQYAIQSPLVYSLYHGLLQFAKQQKSQRLQKAIDLPRWNECDKERSNPKISIATLNLQHRKNKRNHNSQDKYADLCEYFCQLIGASTVISVGTSVRKYAEHLAISIDREVWIYDENGAKIEQEDRTIGIKKKQITDEAFAENVSDTLKNLNSIDLILLGGSLLGDKDTFDYLEEIKNKLFNPSIVIIHQIHKTPKINKKWIEMESRNLVNLSLDFREFGVLFFDLKLSKKKYVLDF